MPVFFSYFALCLLPVSINQNNKGIYGNRKPPGLIWQQQKQQQQQHCRDIKFKKVDGR